MNAPRKRARELSIAPGILPTGRWNTITDVAGRAVAAPTTMVTETQTLDLSGWAAGVYLAHIANGQYAQTLRFQLVR